MPRRNENARRERTYQRLVAERHWIRYFRERKIRFTRPRQQAAFVAPGVVVRLAGWALAVLAVLYVFLVIVPRAVGDDPQPTTTVTVDSTYQGKSAHWWARRAVQARKDANARGHIIRRLQAAIRATAPLGGRVLAAHGKPSATELERGFLCIHNFEGSWTSATGNGYFGGTQMDTGFMRSYGSTFLRAFGTADHWTPAMQLAVSELAYLSGRGFYPWPNTARMCGLL